MSTPIRTALLGAGNSGLWYHAVGNLLESPLYDLVAIASGSAASAAHAQAVTGVESVVGWETLIERPDIDLVVVALPHHLHSPAAIAAARAGKHVLVDKPMAPTVAECDAMIAAAREASVHLEVFQQRRWEEDFQLLLRLVREGAIGDVWRLEVTRFHRGYYRHAAPDAPHTGPDVLKWAHEDASGGGIGFVVGPHPVDQALTVMGTPVGVRGRVRHEPGEDVESWIGIELDFDGGATAAVNVFRAARATPPRFVAHGARGTIVAGDGRSLEVLKGDGSREFYDDLTPPTRLGGYVYDRLAAAIRDHGDLAVGAIAGRAVVDVIERARGCGRKALKV